METSLAGELNKTTSEYMHSRFHMRWTVSVTLMRDPCMGSWILHCLILYMSQVTTHHRNSLAHMKSAVYTL